MDWETFTLLNIISLLLVVKFFFQVNFLWG